MRRLFHIDYSDADFADDLALVHTVAQAESWLHCLEPTARGISLYVNSYIVVAPERVTNENANTDIR